MICFVNQIARRINEIFADTAKNGVVAKAYKMGLKSTSKQDVACSSHAGVAIY